MPINEGEVGHHFTDKYLVGMPEEAHRELFGHRPHKREDHRNRVMDWLEKNNRVLWLICKSFEEDVW